MIKASELRIGNWIDSFHGPYDRTQIDADCFSALDADGFINGDPIPLTPEILEACGFKDMGGNMTRLYPIPHEIAVIVFQMEANALNIYLGESSVRSIQTPTLHELQNTWRYFTGTELAVTFNKIPY